MATSRTPLHHWHVAQRARLVEVNGWKLPAGYTAVDLETTAARVLAIADISAFAKLGLQGPGVPALVEAIGPNSAVTRPRGVALLGDQAPILACRLTEQQLLLLASGPDVTAISNRLGQPPDGIVQHDVTSAYAGFALVGPLLEDMLRSLTSFDVSSSNFMVDSCAETALAGVHAILVRSAELVVPSMRIHVAWDMAEYVWETLVHARRPVGIAPLGLDALQALRAPVQQ